MLENFIDAFLFLITTLVQAYLRIYQALRGNAGLDDDELVHNPTGSSPSSSDEEAFHSANESSDDEEEFYPATESLEDEAFHTPNGSPEREWLPAPLDVIYSLSIRLQTEEECSICHSEEVCPICRQDVCDFACEPRE